MFFNVRFFSIDIIHNLFVWLGLLMCTLTRYLGVMGIFLNHLYCLVGCLRHDCLDTCCFGCLICMCFVFLYLNLFSAIKHVSHGKVL